MINRRNVGALQLCMAVQIKHWHCIGSQTSQFCCDSSSMKLTPPAVIMGLLQGFVHVRLGIGLIHRISLKVLRSKLLYGWLGHSHCSYTVVLHFTGLTPAGCYYVGDGLHCAALVSLYHSLKAIEDRLSMTKLYFGGFLIKLRPSNPFSNKSNLVLYLLTPPLLTPPLLTPPLLAPPLLTPPLLTPPASLPAHLSLPHSSTAHPSPPHSSPPHSSPPASLLIQTRLTSNLNPSEEKHLSHGHVN